LFEALSQLDSLENVKVLVLGGTTYSSAEKDGYFKKVLAQAEHLPIEVTFTGYIEKQQIPNYLKAADICAVPSIFHETCCLSAVEAQAMGIPVIATRIGGIPEYISEESAFLIDYDAQFVENFATGLDHLNHDQTLRQQMREEALKERMRHSQERYYDEFVNCINHFVDE
jgi:glycosyltransferase involved in cell wall biosynthesis